MALSWCDVLYVGHVVHSTFLPESDLWNECVIVFTRRYVPSPVKFLNQFNNLVVLCHYEPPQMVEPRDIHENNISVLPNLTHRETNSEQEPMLEPQHISILTNCATLHTNMARGVSPSNLTKITPTCEPKKRKFKTYLPNVQSIATDQNATMIRDHIQQDNINCTTFTETWLQLSGRCSQQIGDLIGIGYLFYHKPRTTRKGDGSSI